MAAMTGATETGTATIRAVGGTAGPVGTAITRGGITITQVDRAGTTTTRGLAVDGIDDTSMI